MSIHRFSRSILYTLTALLAALFATACSESSADNPDDPGFEEGIPSEVTFSLSSRSGNYTRADGTPKDPTVSVEKIHSWWIAFVDNNGKVTIQQRSEESENGFESETFKCIIPTGTYDIYAFANIPAVSEDDFKKLLADYPKTGDNAALASAGLSEMISGFENNGMQWPSNENIPMTGFLRQVKVKNTVEEAFSIEVIRAVAKVEFSIKNPTDDVITLKSLSFEQVTSSDVSLLPDYDAIGIKAYNPFGTASYGTLEIILGSDVLTKNIPNIFSFYCKESLGKTYDDQTEEAFKISLTVDRKKGDADPKTVSQDFYTKKLKNYINRNDWIHIPIEFKDLVVSDWEVFWKLDAYPPIGGYPPVFGQNADGSTLEATMTYGGEFELYPSSIKKNGKVVAYNDEIDWASVTVSVASGADLFVVQPHLEDNPSIPGTKMIVGDLDPRKEGKAEVEIKFKLKEGPDISSVFTTTFTILRQNTTPS